MMLESSKRYEVTARFGIATRTGDAMGEIVEERETPALAVDALESAVERMTGPMDQVPPMYSAVKHQGKRLYELAREGREVSREPRRIEVHDFRVVAYDWPGVTLRVHCSKGTYVRTLVTNLAESLGTIAHVTALRRISVGPFDAARMVTLEAIEAAAEEGFESLDRWLLGIDAALTDWPAISVGSEQSEALRQGRAVTVAASDPAREVRIYDQAGAFVGTGRVSVAGELRPTRIFHR
jgi:tRNA pseudouridine55 synthase